MYWAGNVTQPGVEYTADPAWVQKTAEQLGISGTYSWSKETGLMLDVSKVPGAGCRYLPPAQAYPAVPTSPDTLVGTDVLGSGLDTSKLAIFGIVGLAILIIIYMVKK